MEDENESGDFEDKSWMSGQSTESFSINVKKGEGSYYKVSFLPRKKRSKPWLL